MKRLLPQFLAHGIDAFVPHDLRRSGRTTLGRLGVSPFIGERVINHSKDVLEDTYDLWDYFDEKRDALERLESYLVQLRDSETAGLAGRTKPVPQKVSGLPERANPLQHPERRDSSDRVRRNPARPVIRSERQPP